MQITAALRPGRAAHRGMPSLRGALIALAVGAASAIISLPPLAAVAGPLERSKPAASLAELWQVLGGCAQITAAPAAAAWSEVTVLLSLKRDGSLLGQPRITHSRLTGGPDEQRAFVSAALSGIAGCLPVSVTPGLGGAIAGRPFRLRIIN
ncbi:hypothetical protein [Methylobacterium sp. J-072]|uniref:hypothetical protein n=1 Tax=Methylobacterium sp. J-072 TaxID=2836651 RepID=UPI001FBB793A|nr:hypothetical protein [Methylobacterium sp. J-072]